MIDIEAILAAPDRSPEARAMDGPRRASDMVGAAGLEPWHSVLELEPGKGWFTDILLRLIEPEGQLIVQQPALLDDFFGKDVFNKIRRAGRPNVTYSSSPFTQLSAASASMDRVLWVQGPHEIWFEPQPGLSFGDPNLVFAEIRRILKQDGLFFVVDNLASQDLSQHSSGQLHRSEPKNLRKYIEYADFDLVQMDLSWIESECDNLTMPTYSPSIHLRTSQFLQIYMPR